MFIKVFEIGSLQTNCYVLWNEEKKAVVFDVAESGYENIVGFLKEKELTLTAVLLTHGHFDHVGGVDKLLEMYGNTFSTSEEIPVYIDEADIDYCRRAAYCANQWHIHADDCLSARAIPDDGIKIDGIDIRVIKTPGHSEGSVIYIVNDEIMISGDTLFYGSIGRTDFPQGSSDKIKQSLEFIKKLEGNYRVFPGHGRETNLLREKELNIWLR